MEHKVNLPLLLLSLTAVILLASCIPLNKQDKKLTSSDEKRQSSCIPRCANPRGFTGCGSCEHSKCLLKGCVHYGAFGPIWKPDNCTTCQCQNSKNEMKCTQTICSVPNCFGYPTMKPPGKCCEECDFGAAKNECKLIPVALMNVSVSSDPSTTCKQVLKHDCTKRMFQSGNKWYKCNPIEGFSELRNNTGCEGIEGRYKDNIGCQQKEIPPEALPEDLDTDPASCNFFIH